MRMLIAGGGTGGHLFPGMAMAEELLSRSPGNEVVFVGTGRGLEARVVPQCGYPLETIPVLPIRGRGFFSVLRSIFTLPRALAASMRIIRSRKPDIVVGVGGYASGPVVLAAWLMRVNRVICEQNTVPGTTSRILGRLAEAVFIAFEESREFFPGRKAHLLGNPIRRELVDNYLRSKIPTGKFTVLVFGGSQGARVINTAFADAVERMKEAWEGMAVIHQTGRADFAEVSARYGKMGFDAEVVEFIEDMSPAYRKADLIVCRAGATSLAELGVCRKPAILIPYPFAADDHQQRNAEAMERAGAAVVIRQDALTGGSLAGAVMKLRGNPDLIRSMEIAAGSVGRPQAAKECVDFCIELVRGR
jgi:UDP-N-acetylglucosamine--N-acetylmuramyl-(pentapeptide) pyrophosphoryl-undecaprenol N-acetylglucosamine transferase